MQKNTYPRIKIGSLRDAIAKAKTSGSGATFSVDFGTTDIASSIRNAGDDKSRVRVMMRVHPETSQATETYTRFVITSKYSVIAKNMIDGKINKDATEIIQSIVARMNYLPINYNRFSKDVSFNSLSETFVRQMLANGEACGELVFRRGGIPSHIECISTNNIEYNDNGVPYISVGDKEFILDSPAIKIISLNQDPDKFESDSYFSSAIHGALTAEENKADLRRSSSRFAMPRVVATIDTKEVIESLPEDIVADHKKLDNELTSIKRYIEETLTGLAPEDALVKYDFIDVEHLTVGNSNNDRFIDIYAKMINGVVASGLKTLPAVIGRGASQQTASAESILYLKIAENLQGRLNHLYSMLLTVAMRSLGNDVFVEFFYQKPNLRPDIELASFRSVEQATVLEQLSEGFISDEEASIRLTGDLPSGNFSGLSGTHFRRGNNPDEIENPYSNTSVTGKGVTETATQKASK